MLEYYIIAGLTVRMDTFGRTLEQAAPYRTEDVNASDILIQSYRDGILELHPNMASDVAEYLGTGLSFYRELIRFQGMMLHSSAVVVDGKAYLFTASSGTGKSTHTKLWLQAFGERAYILNDDKPALRKIDGQWFAFGTPWSGKHDISTNVGVPVGGIAILERGERNEICRASGTDVLLDLLRQVNRPRGAEYRRLLMPLLDQLLREVPIWRLKCNMEPEAAIVAYEAMSGEKFKEN